MTVFEPVIGLEVHAELLTQSKMFCSCAVVDSTSAEPNSSVCEICTGMPGTLPVINQRAVEYALRVALALNCTIAETSVFARKNYFYPDLPKGFQISQYELPLATAGWIEIEDASATPTTKRVRIRRVHLEEDTGKLLHREHHSLVDYNRSGVPLLEIVSEPDLHSVDQARQYSLALRSLLRYLRVNSGDLQKGVMRFEANVSVRPIGSEELGTRTEIKNLNSFRALSRSIEYEIDRQAASLRSGEPVVQNTVGWDEVRQVTVSQRSKEEAHDYRYFPEPDLPPLHIEAAWVDRVRSALPELPAAKRARFVEKYGLSAYTAGVLTAERPVADYYEAAVESAHETSPVKIANWLSSDLFGLLNDADIEIDQSNVTPEALARLVSLVETGRISAASGKIVLGMLFKQGGSPESLVDEQGLAQLEDQASIRPIVDQVLSDNPDQVAEYLAGKAALSEWFLGRVIRATQGKADPATARAELDAALLDLDDRDQNQSSR
ncbi:MAG: Asp-tRNA(Asn)/Glu-tRNA(Gln) amidotransferase subunit GatB [Anaerolineae bacterium]|nr:MAG: Asp-tRNA(Asn)/Glu-tRNA(Gln) amidotransferase subunit GatB [Anaerolineae bacterium]